MKRLLEHRHQPLQEDQQAKRHADQETQPRMAMKTALQGLPRVQTSSRLTGEKGNTTNDSFGRVTPPDIIISSPEILLILTSEGKFLGGATTAGGSAGASVEGAAASVHVFLFVAHTVSGAAAAAAVRVL